MISTFQIWQLLPFGGQRTTVLKLSQSLCEKFENSSNNNYFLVFLRVDVPRGSPVHLHAVSAGAGQTVGVRPQGLHLLLLLPENPQKKA